MSRKLLLVPLAVGAWLAFSAICLAQTSTGSITGTVSDPTGAVVPGAKIEARHLQTGRVYSVVTNDAGVFNVGSLPTGKYTFTASATGFETITFTGIEIDAGAVVQQNVAMRIGAVAQAVTVEGQAAQVQLATGQTGGTITTTEIERLNVNGRNFQALGTLIPGVNNTSAGSELSGMGLSNSMVLSSNGLATTKNLNMVDGSFNMNVGSQNGAPVNPEPDTISELSIITNNYSAKYGYTGGAQIHVETKTGGSDFHGSVHEYLRNDALDSRNTFSSSVPILKQNLFGYDIGGPVYIPGHYNTDKSKTFFFWAQNWRVRHSGSVRTGATPTTAMRQGDFSAEAARTGVNITDPETGLPFPNNQIPTTRFDSNAVLLMNQLLPLPNNLAGGFNNYLNVKPSMNNQAQEVIRIDHSFSDKLRVMARYIEEDVYARNSTVYSSWGSTPFSSVGSDADTFNKNAYFRITSVPDSTTVNNIAVSFSELIFSESLTGAYRQPSGYSVRPVYTNPTTSVYIPTLNFSGGWSSVGTGAALTLGSAPDRALTWTDDFSKVVGRHTLLAGVFFNYTMADQDAGATPQGSYSFSGNTTGNSMADFLLGYAQSYTQTSYKRRGSLRFIMVEPYIQDDWKVTRRLTLNLGLRYSYQPPWSLLQATTNFYPKYYDPTKAPEVTSAGVLIPTTNYDSMNGLQYAGESTYNIPKGFSKTPKNTLMPRIGFAWDVFGDGKTAVRGGFGMTYYRTEDVIWNTINNPPAMTSVTLSNAPLSDPAAGAPVTTKYPVGVTVIDPNAVPSQIMSFSLGVQRALSPNTALDVYYAGNMSHHMNESLDINQPLPTGGYDFDPRLNPGSISANSIRPYLGYAALSTRYTNGDGHYHSLQVGLRRRYSKNFSVQLAYTYGKSLGVGNDIGTIQDAYNPGRSFGIASFDRTHALSIGYVYDLPFFQDVKGAVARGLLKGWGISGLTQVDSGFALTPGLSTGSEGLAARPNRGAGESLFPDGTRTRKNWFNTAAFLAPAAGYFGNAALGSIRGPGLVDFDFSLVKQTSYHEKIKTEFRAGFFNLFNHANYSGVATGVGAGNYGQITSALDPRIVEFGLKVWF